MAKAVVFYSLEGNSAKAASALAEKIGAKLVELKETKPRTLKPLGFMKAGFQAAFGIKSRLSGNPSGDVSACDELHVITPIWASSPVPAINAFVANCSMKGKRVFIYTVQADPNTNAVKAWAKLTTEVQKSGGQVVSTKGLQGGAPGKGIRGELATEICEMQS